ncbi:mucin-5AC isoform X2 [Nilaparvata lugens]|uniref:mucin-5AC isoform X2 n=1 Tax=Nilaparvata lugens TaxID=108931 RepID=UPI00193CA5AA|nr:mucin-5AC isoform X2 [Nilaparvata lugens]
MHFSITFLMGASTWIWMLLVLPSVDYSYAQGQDYFFANTGQQQPHFLTYQQPQRTQQTQQQPQQFSNFFSPAVESSVFTPFRSSSSAQNSQFQPVQNNFGVQPSHYQIPPSASADNGQFIDAFRQPAPTQFRTNQHLPQPFHHLQAQQSGAQRFPFEIQPPLNPQRFQETSPRFQASEPVTLPKPTFNQNSFIGVKNTEDETGRTTQSYVNVHHPQGLLEQSPTPQTTSNRWKQADNLRRQKKPVSPLRQNDFSNGGINSFVDQQLQLDESTSETPVSSTTDFTSLRTGAAVDKRRNEVQNYSRPRNQPTKENTLPRQYSYIESRARKPTTSITAFNPEEENIKPTTVRGNRLQIARVKPTTYSPLLHSGTLPNRSRNQLKSRFNNSSREGVRQSETNNNLENLSASTVSSSEFDEKQVIKEYQRHSFNKKVTNGPPFNRGSANVSNKRVVLPSSIPSVVEEHHEETKHGDEETIENATDFVPYDEEELSDDHDDENDEHVDDSPHHESHGEHDDSQFTPDEHKINTTSTFEVLPMHQDQPQVADDNFKKFVDSISIDSTDSPPNLAGEPEEKAGEVSGVTVTMESNNKNAESTLNHTRSMDEDDELSSVVTTMSISNESDKVLSGQSHLANDQINAPPSTKSDSDDDTPQPTESWVIVASVQTSRSVSGARFLPSGSVNQEEFPSPLAPKPTSNIGNKTSSETTSKSESVETSAPEILKTDGMDNENSKGTEREETPPITVPSSTAVETVSTKSPVSTESIIDKLDRVQSELSSGILTGGFRPGANKLDIDVLPEMTSENNGTLVTSSSTSMPTSSTTTSTTTTSTTTPGPNDPPPVVIRKFSPSSRRGTTTTTTHKPNKKIAALIENIQFDELTGLLPAGFKPRSGFTRKSTTTSTTVTTSKPPSDSMLADEAVEAKSNSTREGSGRSSGLGGLENKIKFDDVSAFLPPGFKPTASSTEKPKGLESLLSKIKFDDASSLLPPGYKPRKSDKNETKEEKKNESKEEKKIPEIKFEVPSNLLPPGYKPPGKSSAEKKVEPSAIDISALLPPGYKLTTEAAATTESNVLDAILSKVKLKDVSALLPAGFNETTTGSPTSSSAPETTTAAGLKVVFPSRPGGTRKNSNSSPSRTKSAGGLGPVQPKIQKGWPTRATTEFTGWPTSSTTPIPIEKIIAQAKAAAAAAAAAATAAAAAEEATTTTTTTTSTTTTPRSTTPGICSEDCNLAATIKLVGGTKWVPELLDHNTKEWQLLADEVEQQLENVYSSSESLSKWYKRITIDAFSEGSVLVDYFVELSELGRTVNTADMKRMFHDSLHRATVASDALLGEASTADAAASNATTKQFKLGKFVVDPKFTDFVVLPKAVVPTVGMAEEDVFLPQWAIAVIVIGLASLLFVIIFGVTVLVNRHKSAKKKSPVTLTEDMLNELNKNHMGGLDNYGADDLYNMEDVWNDKPPKKRSSGSLHDNSMANLYDSWRSEWNGYYYNAYYGNGSSTSGGYGRRRSDYDTNF